MIELKKLTKVAALAVSGTMALALSACGDDTAPTENTPAVTIEPTAESTDAATTEASPTGETSAADESAPAEQGTIGAGGDLTAAAVAAIGTAEAEAGGTAHAIDDPDWNGNWEVDVQAGDRNVEVTVSGDGSSVVSTEDDDDVDADEREALNGAQVSITEAIEIAITEAGGELDDVEFDDEDGRWVWEVSIQDRGNDVYVDVQTGEIVKS